MVNKLKKKKKSVNISFLLLYKNLFLQLGYRGSEFGISRCITSVREDELVVDVLGFVYKCKCWWWQNGLCSVRMSAPKQQISFLFYSKPFVLYGFGCTRTRGQIPKRWIQVKYLL